MSTSRSYGSRCVLVSAILMGLRASGGPVEKRESTYLVGIYGVSASEAYLTVRLVSCDSNLPNRGAMLRTADGGKTWQRVWSSPGPSSIQVVARSGKELLFFGTVGEEGPDLDPFVLLRRRGGRWRRVTIHRGDSKLEGVYRHGDILNVQIQQIDVHSNEWTGPTVTYQSRDGGRSWKVSKFEGPLGDPAMAISKSSQDWQVKLDQDGGYIVEKKGDEGSRAVSHFPAPKACD